MIFGDLDLAARDRWHHDPEARRRTFLENKRYGRLQRPIHGGRWRDGSRLGCGRRSAPEESHRQVTHGRDTKRRRILSRGTNDRPTVCRRPEEVGQAGLAAKFPTLSLFGVFGLSVTTSCGSGAATSAALSASTSRPLRFGRSACRKVPR